jgi:hypothetical protein
MLPAMTWTAKPPIGRSRMNSVTSLLIALAAVSVVAFRRGSTPADDVDGLV